MTSLTWLSAPDAILGAGDIAGQMMLQTAIDAVVGDQRGLLGKGQKREEELGHDGQSPRRWRK